MWIKLIKDYIYLKNVDKIKINVEMERFMNEKKLKLTLTTRKMVTAEISGNA